MDPSEISQDIYTKEKGPLDPLFGLDFFNDAKYEWRRNKKRAGRGEFRYCCGYVNTNTGETCRSHCYRPRRRNSMERSQCFPCRLHSNH